ncbi:MAG: hypothetical protein GF317_09300 [Candidatus Lokiarchaeota archaeon]|nr:hypothetical protein [Candidatus Lokiarchaeota archaeon]MBD3199907.1 hypothetical protein [Candidatus Lokiarchaeota archaeon]
MIYLAYPEDVPSSISTKTLRFFDLDIEEQFFEIVLINKNQKIVNLYFEIPSKWARGKCEMVMLSLSMKKHYKSELVYDFLRDTVHKIVNTEDIFKCFYKEDDFREDDIEIDMYYEILKKILRNGLNELIQDLSDTDS